MNPTHSVLFQIYNFNYTLKYSKDIYSSNDFEITSNNQIIVKTPNINFVEKETYFLVYSHGIVVGLNDLKYNCGLESFGVFGNWSFTISKFYTLLRFIFNKNLREKIEQIKFFIEI